MIFRTHDGIFLFCESYRVPKARASLLVVHGLGEHLGRYKELVRECRKLRLDVHCLDLRGHGRSQGVRGHFQNISELHDDMSAWIEHLVSNELLLEQPCFLLGHSLGGLVAFTFLPKYVRKPLYPELCGLILSAPALGLRWNPLKLLEAKLARKLPLFLRNLQIPSGVEPSLLSHDKAEVRAYERDPLVHGWITPAAFLAMEKAIRSAYKIVPKVKVPILFLVPGKDKVVNSKATEAMAQKCAVAHPGKISIKIFHSFFHEPFHETKRERAYLELKKWILQCLQTKNTKKDSYKSSRKEATGRVTLH